MVPSDARHRGARSRGLQCPCKVAGRRRNAAVMFVPCGRVLPSVGGGVEHGGTGAVTVRGRYSPIARVLSRIGFGVVSIVAAVLIRVPLEPILEGRNDFIVLEPAIAIAAWYGGLVSGTAATASAVIASLLFYLHPVGRP